MRQTVHNLKKAVANGAEVNQATARIESKLAEIKHTQLATNHQYLSLLNEIKDRSKNSGSLVLSEQMMVTKIFSGLKMYLDPRDIAVSVHLALDSIWEHEITAAWIKCVTPNATVLDVGANFGYFGFLAAQLTDKKHSKVVLFEPNPALIPYMHNTANINWLNEQSVIVNAAVSNEPGELVLNVLEGYTGSSSVQPLEKLQSYLGDKMTLEAQPVSVPAITVDQYCSDNNIQTVDLIKMDIEGYEDKAYEGMRQVVVRSPEATLFIEFTPQAYDEPQVFFDTMYHDFGHIYTIDSSGAIIPADERSYDDLVSASDDWIMFIFSKKANLHE